MAIANREKLCFSVLRYYPVTLRDRIRRAGLWQDLEAELRLAAYEAERQGLSEHDTCLLASRRIYAFLKAYGYCRLRRDGHNLYSKQALSLNQPLSGMDTELWEALPDEESDLDGELDAKHRLEAVPPGIVKIARKLEQGDPLTAVEKARLLRFRRDGKESGTWRWAMKRYQERRALGLCVRCGESAGSSSLCLRCSEEHRQRQALYKRQKGKLWYNKLREHWRKEGRCPRCGRPPQPGRKKCPQCLTKDREYLRSWRERRQASQGAESGV